MYEPEVNDYVIMDEHVQGWVYFKSKEYITIEMNVKPKNLENYQASSIHANDRLLVLCYHQQWKDLKYIKSRQSIYETDLETLGEGIRAKSIEK